MFNIFVASKIARKAFKEGNWTWASTAGVPKAKDIAAEIMRQLVQQDQLRKGNHDLDYSLETSCGCISTRCERDGNVDEVNVFLDLGSFFVDKNESIMKTLAGDV